jgi:hypothetical protein
MSGAKRQARRSANCGANDQAYSNWYVASTVLWWWNQSTTPSYLNQSSTLNSLQNAHSQWTTVSDWCGIPDLAAATQSYGGTTTRHVTNDGVYIVEFGSVDALGGGCAGSAACTITNTAPDLHVIDSDTRFDTTRTTWINGGASGKIDIWSTMAHEFGHTLGFAHAPTSQNVMYGARRANDITDQLLGRGDANEVNTKY